MSSNELSSKVTELMELKRMQEELNAEIEAVQDAIKAFMGETEQITVGVFKVTWKPVTTNRIDTAALKKELPEIAERFSKTSITRRFTVA